MDSLQLLVKQVQSKRYSHVLSTWETLLDRGLKFTRFEEPVSIRFP